MHRCIYDPAAYAFTAYAGMICAAIPRAAGFQSSMAS